MMVLSAEENWQNSPSCFAVWKVDSPGLNGLFLFGVGLAFFVAANFCWRVWLNISIVFTCLSNLHFLFVRKDPQGGSKFFYAYCE